MLHWNWLDIMLLLLVLTIWLVFVVPMLSYAVSKAIVMGRHSATKILNDERLDT